MLCDMRNKILVLIVLPPSFCFVSAFNGTTNDVDSSLFEDQDPTKMETNLQVTFSEPLATDGPLPPNTADNGDDENGDKPKSILKGNDDTKGKISELEVEPYIMKRKISPVGTSKTVSQKPVVGNSGTDLRLVIITYVRTSSYGIIMHS